MTFSILAVDREESLIGLATASCGLFTGAIVPLIDPDGNFLGFVQACPSTAIKSKCLELLAGGISMDALGDYLSETDSHLSYRQIGLLNRSGDHFIHTGCDTLPYAGHIAGESYLVAGNMLFSKDVLTGMKDTFEKSSDRPFVDRLIAALESAQIGGGQVDNNKRLRVRAACLYVQTAPGTADVDLRVDVHDNALQELSRLNRIYGSYSNLMDKCQYDPEHLSELENQERMLPDVPPVYL